MKYRIAFVVLSILALYTSHAQFVYFDVSRFNTNSNQPESIVHLDVEKDGDTDFVVAYSKDKKVVLYRKNNNENKYSVVPIYSFLDGAADLTKGDFNNDGFEDIIASGTVAGNHRIVYLENSKTGGFRSFVEVVKSTSNAFIGLEAVDLDQDADLDFISVEFSTVSSPGELILWQNDGNAGFTKKVLSTNSVDARQTLSLDYDNDGDLDIVSAEGLGKKLALYTNNGSLGFTKTTLIDDLNICNSIATHDFNNDQKPDFLVSEYVGDMVKLYVSNAVNSYDPVVISDDVDTPSDVKLIDFQNDGRMDILVAYNTENAVMMYTNAGNDAFGLPRFNQNGFYPLTNAFFLTVGDFNLDNKQDFAAVGLGYTGFVTFHNLTAIVSADDLPNNTGDFSLYPSLVSQQVTIKSRSAMSIDQITIFNLSGQTICQRQVSDINTTIDCNSYTPGPYFAKVTDLAGRTKTIQFIKVE
ncbi:MAG: T9SS type A sorting domain-containing protein [Saprospiraceae bacterium]|nr:T9SS type A sorting domain-containing protein [Saprospiraceae bacterium]